MTNTTNTNPGPTTIVKMHNGFYAYVAADGRAEVARCDWLVQVPSGNPEPDCIEDTYKVIPCGARVTWLSESGSSFACEAGHDHTAYSEGGADIEYAREMEERYAELG